MADGAPRLDTAARIPPTATSERRAGINHDQLAHVRLDAATDLTNAVLWEADDPTRFTYVSDNAAGFLGYPSDAWLSEPNFWMSRVHAADRAAARRFREGAFAACRDYEISYRMIRADGSSIWVCESAYASPAAPAFRGILP